MICVGAFSFVYPEVHWLPATSDDHADYPQDNQHRHNDHQHLAKNRRHRNVCGDQINDEADQRQEQNYIEYSNRVHFSSPYVRILSAIQPLRKSTLRALSPSPFRYGRYTRDSAKSIRSSASLDVYVSSISNHDAIMGLCWRFSGVYALLYRELELQFPERNQRRTVRFIGNCL